MLPHGDNYSVASLSSQNGSARELAGFQFEISPSIQYILRTWIFGAMLIICIFALTINSVVMFILIVSKTSRPQGAVYIGNLLIADLFYSLLAIPYQMHYYRIVGKDFTFHEFQSCKASVFFYLFAIFGSLLNTLIVTLDRYIAVTRPFRYKEILSPLRSVFLIMLIWTLTLVAAIVGASTCNMSYKAILPIRSCLIHRVLDRRVVILICTMLLVVLLSLFIVYAIIVNEVKNNLRRTRPIVKGRFEKHAILREAHKNIPKERKEDITSGANYLLVKGQVPNNQKIKGPKATPGIANANRRAVIDTYERQLSKNSSYLPAQSKETTKTKNTEDLFCVHTRPKAKEQERDKKTSLTIPKRSVSQIPADKDTCASKKQRENSCSLKNFQTFNCSDVCEQSSIYTIQAQINDTSLLAGGMPATQRSKRKNASLVLPYRKTESDFERFDFIPPDTPSSKMPLRQQQGMPSFDWLHWAGRGSNPEPIERLHYLAKTCCTKNELCDSRPSIDNTKLKKADSAETLKSFFLRKPVSEESRKIPFQRPRSLSCFSPRPMSDYLFGTGENSKIRHNSAAVIPSFKSLYLNSEENQTYVYTQDNADRHNVAKLSSSNLVRSRSIASDSSIDFPAQCMERSYNNAATTSKKTAGVGWKKQSKLSLDSNTNLSLPTTRPASAEEKDSFRSISSRHPKLYPNQTANNSHSLTKFQDHNNTSEPQQPTRQLGAGSVQMFTKCDALNTNSKNYTNQRLVSAVNRAKSREKIKASYRKEIGGTKSVKTMFGSSSNKIDNLVDTNRSSGAVVGYSQRKRCLYIEAKEDIFHCSRRNSWANIYFSKTNLPLEELSRGASEKVRASNLDDRAAWGSLALDSVAGTNRKRPLHSSTPRLSQRTLTSKISTAQTLEAGVAQMTDTPMIVTPLATGTLAGPVDTRLGGSYETGNKRKISNQNLKEIFSFSRNLDFDYQTKPATIFNESCKVNTETIGSDKPNHVANDRDFEPNPEVRITMVVSNKKPADNKAVHAAVNVLGLFIACWMPLLVTLILQIIHGYNLEYLLQVSNLCTALNSFFNPILYVTRTQGFKMACCRIKSRLFR